VPHYRVELHSHCLGDPLDTFLTHTIFEHIDQARKVGIDAIAVTWHRKACVHPEAAAYARERNVLLISGMEADVNLRHLVVLNVGENDLPGEPDWDEVRALRARRPDVLMIAPHPFYPHPSCMGNEMTEHSDCIDAVEWCKLHVNWLPGRVNPNLRAARWAHRHGKPLVACSDAHSLASIGINASTVEADALTPEALFAAIRAGRISFHRRALDLGTLVYETGHAVIHQPKHFKRWAAKIAAYGGSWRTAGSGGRT
jgi:predicted metal-dependent phosphoesterase TrpH